MNWLWLPAGFLLDQIIGDPHSIPHPVEAIGRLIDWLEGILRPVFPRTPGGETAAGGVLWLITAGLAWLVPWVLLRRGAVHSGLRFVLECVMCGQILAVKSLRQESMKVYAALSEGDVAKARHAVSMIVGRDTDALDADGVARAAVETVAENTTDGITAPLLYLALGGPALGFFYKAVNTMDSMLGWREPPYTHFGTVPARMDDALNFLPSRLTAVLMLVSGKALGLDVRNGWRIFQRDRRKHASPNAGQTESVCAGLLGVRLAGDAWYHGVRHEKPYLGDPLREIRREDIPRTCRLMEGTALLALAVCCVVRLLLWG